MSVLGERSFPDNTGDVDPPSVVEGSFGTHSPSMPPGVIADANFRFVKGRCHFSERSLPFETVDAIYKGRLHTSLQRKLKETN